jgi:hypothetical protein
VIGHPSPSPPTPQSPGPKGLGLFLLGVGIQQRASLLAFAGTTLLTPRNGLDFETKHEHDSLSTGYGSKTADEALGGCG